MKTRILKPVAMLLMLAFAFTAADAQVVKMKKREFKKAAKQRTKQLEKGGYQPKGAGTVSLYMKNALNLEFAMDENGDNLTPVVYTSAVDPTFEGAVNACRAAARAALAGNIETNVGELVKRSLNTEQVSARSADGISKTVTAGKQLIAQKISMEDTYILFREVKDERDGKTLIEVEYAASYSRRLAMERAREYVRQEMKDEAEELHKDLDKIFNLD